VGYVHVKEIDEKEQVLRHIKRTKNGIEWTLRGKSISVGYILRRLRQLPTVDFLLDLTKMAESPEPLSMIVSPVGRYLLSLTPCKGGHLKIGYIISISVRNLFSP